MFGLIRPQKCCSASKTASYKYHRMHYCGTCKTIGQSYGHSARLALNYDIVFLSELLSELLKEDLATWQTGYQAINKCFTMPQRHEQIPFSLEYAADVNILLAALKIDDHVKDKKKWSWKLVRLFYNRKFKKAFKKIEKTGIQAFEIWQWIDLQAKRELNSSSNFGSLEKHLQYFAEPTAQITSLIFEKGGQNLSKELQELLQKIGYQFGQLNYILDAFEDLEQDIFEREFNPLIQWFDAKQTLKEVEFEQVRQLLLQLQENFSKNLQQLPILNAERYLSYLNANLALRLYKKRLIPKTLKEKFQQRLSKAKEIASEALCNQHHWFVPIQHLFISFSIFLVPAVAAKMPLENENIKWDWRTFFANILPFSNNNELLDDSIEEAEDLPNKNKTAASGWFCCDCCSGGGCDCGGCCAAGEAGEAVSGCSSCCEGCSGCGECCGGCAECGAGCSC